MASIGSAGGSAFSLNLAETSCLDSDRVGVAIHVHVSLRLHDAKRRSRPRTLTPCGIHNSNSNLGVPYSLGVGGFNHLHHVSRRWMAGGAAGVLDMDVEAEAYMDVFTASAAPPAIQRRRIEATAYNGTLKTRMRIFGI